MVARPEPVRKDDLPTFSARSATSLLGHPAGEGDGVGEGAPARGRLRGSCRLDNQARAAIKSLLLGETDKVSATTNVEIRDPDDLMVCRGTFEWRIRRIHPA